MDSQREDVVRFLDSNTEATGKYKLQINKVDESGNSVEGTSFNVNGTVLSDTTDSDGMVQVASEDITEYGQQFVYEITEVETRADLFKLKNPVKVYLKSGTGTKQVGGNNEVYFKITSATFEGGSSSKNVQTENNTVVPLTLSVEVDEENSLSTVTLIIPNSNKKYDLALTKTIVNGREEFVKYLDVNLDGVITVNDSRVFVCTKAVLEEEQSTEPIKEGLERAYQVPEGNDIYSKYYKYLTEEDCKEIIWSIIEKLAELENELELDEDQKLSPVMDENKNITAELCGRAAIAINTFHQVHKEFDRINGISVNKLNKNGCTTASYDMNKNTKQVKISDIITYRITVYNEGDINAKDVEITDYLPQGLKVCNNNEEIVENGTAVCSVGSKDYIWQVNGNKAVIKLTDEIIEAFKNNKLKSTNAYITCKLDEGVSVGTVLYNVAEISDSTPCDEAGTPLENPVNDSCSSV